MYAIIRTGGKQYKVNTGDVLMSSAPHWFPVHRLRLLLLSRLRLIKLLSLRRKEDKTIVVKMATDKISLL